MGKCKDGKPIKLTAGQNLYIHIDKARDGDNTLISTTYKQLTETVNIGYTILLKDGACTTEVLKIEEVSKLFNARFQKWLINAFFAAESS